MECKFSTRLVLDIVQWLVKLFTSHTVDFVEVAKQWFLPQSKQQTVFDNQTIRDSEEFWSKHLGPGKFHIVGNNVPGFVKKKMVWFVPAISKVANGKCLLIQGTKDTYSAAHVLFWHKGQQMVLSAERFIDWFMQPFARLPVDDKIKALLLVLDMISMANPRGNYANLTCKIIGKPAVFEFGKDGSHVLIPISGDKTFKPIVRMGDKRFRGLPMSVQQWICDGENPGPLMQPRYEGILVDTRHKDWKEFYSLYNPRRFAKDGGQSTRNGELHQVSVIKTHMEVGPVLVASGTVADVDLDHDRMCVVIDSDSALGKWHEMEFVLLRTIAGTPGAGESPDRIPSFEIREEGGKLIFSRPRLDVLHLDNDKEDWEFDDEINQTVIRFPRRRMELLSWDQPQHVRCTMLPGKFRDDRNRLGVIPVHTFAMKIKCRVKASKIGWGGKVTILDVSNWNHPDLEELRKRGIKVVFSHNNADCLRPGVAKYGLPDVVELDNLRGCIVPKVIVAALAEPPVPISGVLRDGPYTRKLMTTDGKKLLDRLNFEVHDGKIVDTDKIHLVRIANLATGGLTVPVKAPTELARWFGDVMPDVSQQLLGITEVDDLITEIDEIYGLQVYAGHLAKQDTSPRGQRRIARMAFRCLGRKGFYARCIGFHRSDPNRLQAFLEYHYPELHKIASQAGIRINFVAANMPHFPKDGKFSLALQKKAPRFQGAIDVTIIQHCKHALGEGDFLLLGAIDPRNGSREPYVCDATDNDGDHVLFVPTDLETIKEHTGTFGKAGIGWEPKEVEIWDIADKLNPIPATKQEVIAKVKWFFNLLFIGDGQSKESLGVLLARKVYDELLMQNINEDDASLLVQPVLNIGFCPMLKTDKGVAIVDALMKEARVRNTRLPQIIAKVILRKHQDDVNWEEVLRQLQGGKQQK